MVLEAIVVLEATAVLEVVVALAIVALSRGLPIFLSAFFRDIISFIEEKIISIKVKYK